MKQGELAGIAAVLAALGVMALTMAALPIADEDGTALEQPRNKRSYLGGPLQVGRRNVLPCVQNLFDVQAAVASCNS